MVSPTLLRAHRAQTLTLGLGLALLSAAAALGGCASLIGLDGYSVEEDGGGGERGEVTPVDDTARCEDGCDDGNDCTTDRCVDERCVHTAESLGSECASGVCDGQTDGPACVVCVDDQPGEAQDAGCPAGAPSCRGGTSPACTGCTSAEDCDDGDACTVESCEDATCVSEPAAAGASCDGGVCDGETQPSCVACVDDGSGLETDTGCSAAAPLCEAGACAACSDTTPGIGVDLGCNGGAPLCDEGTCVLCSDTAAGAGVDLGCEAATPLCSGGACLACTDTAAGAGVDLGCDAGAPLCEAGACITCSDTAADADQDLGCDAAAPVCRSGECKACDAVELLVDGNFDLPVAQWPGGVSPWTTSNSTAANYRGATGEVTPRSGTYMASVTTAKNQTANLYQRFTLPANTVEVTSSGYYHSSPTSGSGDALQDYVYVAYYTYAASGHFYGHFFDSDDIDPVTSSWQDFSFTETDVSKFLEADTGAAYAGDALEVEYNLVGVTDNDNVVYTYYVDDLSVVALVCAP